MFNAEEFIKICHKVYEKGFVSCFDGNISVRTPKKTFLITPSGVCKGEITIDNILEIDAQGKIINGKGKVSTENKIHLFIYGKRKDVNAVIHCHPVYATAFATAGISLDKPVFPEVVLTIGRIPLCKYATPSTDEVPKSIEPYVDYANVFLLQNHGAVSVGKDLQEAYNRMEKLEHTAKILSISKNIGGEKEISKEKLKQLYSIAEETYGIKLNSKNKFFK
jgi:L-fuculose-phosphate aldolase